MLFKKIILSAVVLLFVLSSEAIGQEKDKMKKDSIKKEMMNDMMSDSKMMKINKNSYDIAIEGYDPVAYFTIGKAVMGNEKYSLKLMDATWNFSSKEHLNMFKENPGKFVPQYGGFCTYAVSKNYLAEIDPAAWTIIDNKLYLNYNKSVSETFNKNAKDYIKNAEMNWDELGKVKDKMMKEN